MAENLASVVDQPLSQRQRYERRLSALKKDRSSWEGHWRELATYFLPRKGRWLFEESRGEKVNQNLLNNTSRMAVRTLSSGMMAGLTSPARPWFRLVTPDPELMEFRPVKDWLWLVEARMRDVFSKGNLYNVLPTVYQELGVFNTASMMALEDVREVIRFYPSTIGSYYLGQSERNEIDVKYRERVLTVRQMVSMFDWNKLSDTVKSHWRNGHYEQTVNVYHIIEPNDNRSPHYVDSLNMPWRSVWMECSSKSSQRGGEDLFLRTSGFRQKPFMSPRWETTNDDVYGGAGPGMDSLGDVKALQLQERRKAQAIDKLVDPAMLMPDSLKNQRNRALPGATIYADVATGMQGARPLYEIKPDIMALREDMSNIEDRINHAFYVDLFMMLAMSDRRQMTATEVAERHEEKLLMLGPVLERLNDELLDPIIVATFDLMMDAGVLPPPPEELAQFEPKVEYISILAQAQRMVGLNSVDRLWSLAGAIAQVVPEVVDKLDADQTIDEYAEMLGVVPGIVRSDEEVEEVRQRKAQAQQQAMAAEQAQQLAATTQQLAETPMEGDTALSRIAAGMAGA